MKQQAWWWVVGVVVVVGILVILFGSRSESDTAALSDTLSEVEDAAESTSHPRLAWEFAPAGGNEDTGAYRTSVTLLVDGEKRDLGVYDGSCMILDEASSWPLVQNELTGVICYFAGAGSELGVFHENGAFVVKKGVVDEGSAEVPGTRGNYETLFTL